MDKAYDTILGIEADATIISKLSNINGGERFRYQCLCCGEEVYLAAAESREKAPHFRHRRGNNDIDCESYLGQPGIIDKCIIDRKRSIEHISFSFNIEQKTFEIALSLDKDSIDILENESGELSVYTKYLAQPFITVPICKNVINSDNANYFILSEYANDYLVSIGKDTNKIIYYDIIKEFGTITIFKINKKDEHYRRNVSDLIYTNQKYLAISEEKLEIEKLVHLNGVSIDGDIFSFYTLNRLFFAIIFDLSEMSFDVNNFFQKHNLQIVNSESLDVLWPPVSNNDLLTLCNEDNVYVSSSFPLIPHGNINIDEDQINNWGDGIYKINLSSKISIYEKNIELHLDKCERLDYESICEDISVFYADHFIVPDDYTYYLFDKYGCSELSATSKVYLTGKDKVIGYKNGIAKVYIYGCIPHVDSKRDIIDNILKYCPRKERFVLDDYMNASECYDEVIEDYLESCYRSGIINSIVKQYILENKF